MVFDSSSSSKGIANLNRARNALADVFEKLSSGKRITKASDDPAGLAIYEQLASNIKGLDAVGKNVRQADSSIQIASGALDQIQNITTRLKELAIQSKSGTLSDSDRDAIDGEYQELTAEVNRIAQSTQFNGKSLLDGSSLSVQIGLSSSANDQLTVNGVDAVGLASALSGQNVQDESSADNAIAALDTFSQGITQAIGNLGAAQSRFSYVSQTTESTKLAYTESASRIGDADYAELVAKQTALQIRTQASTALIAQASRLDASSIAKLLS